MQLRTLKLPLKDIHITQPFGVNWVGKGAYSHNPSGKHSGLDFRARIGTKIYAPCGGVLDNIPNHGAGGNTQILTSKTLGLKIVFCHLSKFVEKNTVKTGQVISLSGNTGGGTGPHLHFGTCPLYWRVDGAGPYVENYHNGYRGYIDPEPLFSADAFMLPVEKGYGEEKHMSLVQYYAANAYFLKTTGRLMNVMERNALIFGYWDLRAVLDPSMFDTWSKMTKPAYLKKLGKL